MKSTNIHLFYDVYLMEHTDCQAVKLLVFVACVCSFCFYLLVLFVRFLFILIFLYCKIVIFTVCCFSVLLDGLWLSRIKRITYLLTCFARSGFLTHSVELRHPMNTTYTICNTKKCEGSDLGELMLFVSSSMLYADDRGIASCKHIEPLFALIARHGLPGRPCRI